MQAHLALGLLNFPEWGQAVAVLAVHHPCQRLLLMWQQRRADCGYGGLHAPHHAALCEDVVEHPRQRVLHLRRTLSEGACMV